MADDSDSSSGFGWGLVVGLALGGVAGAFLASGPGGRLGFDLEKIDELAIAVTQACGSAIETAEETWGHGATLKIGFAAIEGGIEVDVDSIAPTSAEALVGLPVPAPPQTAQLARARKAEMEIQRAVAAEMIRLFVDDFR